MYRQVLILMSLLLAGCAGQGLDPEKKQDKASEAEATKAKPKLMMPGVNRLAFNLARPAMPNVARTSTMNTN
jgi:PBP1b-binding outer membrane lipoprotein LpoB